MCIKKACIILLCCLPVFSFAANGPLYRVLKGHVEFSSDAPMELIRASSDKLDGILDLSGNKFAFRIPIVSFAGFNNPMQRDHFNENYLESEAYPYAIYTGKIIEDIDYTKKGVYSVRTKGKFTIHGVSRERIINSQIRISRNKISIQSDFTVSLADYNIKIPRMVNNNLSKEIQVTVSAVLVPQ